MEIKDNVFQIGSVLPIIIGATLSGVTEDNILKIEINNLKKEILEILRERKRISIMDLSDILNTSPRKIVLAITELEKEGLIKNI